MHLDHDRFEEAHALFEEHMLRRSPGVPFTNFEHPFLWKDEIEPKIRIHSEATEKLMLDRWKGLRRSTGKIVEATRNACKVSRNLLEHRFGPQRNSDAALYRVGQSEQVKGLEAELFCFFRGGDYTASEFGPRFDCLAQYLQENHLGCNWALLAYLAFLACPQRYFPVRPTHFDRLLRFYGTDESIAGSVSWQRYSVLLDLAEALKAKLMVYGQASAVEIQSYMWVVSYLLVSTKVRPKDRLSPPDFAAELNGRVARARERERIGLAGEQYVYEYEQHRLTAAGRPDMASEVRWVSREGDDSGFDIRSFETDGRELHIEVKTTSRSVADDLGFWISQSEVDRAKEDASWTIYRVCDIGLSPPSCENLGNLLQCDGEEWSLAASGVYATRHPTTIGGPKP